MGGERRDWLQTLRQTAPRVGRVLRNLAPTFEFEDIAQIDRTFLDQHGIRGLIWDVDGTLTSYHGAALSELRSRPIQRLLADPGLRHVILSNCGEKRYDELGRMFPEVPILKGYETPDGIAYRQRVGGGETWEGAPPAEGMRPIRKPNADLVEYAARVLGQEPASIAMVGDQYWTDVAGANMAGVRSIRVPPVEPGTFPRTLRVLQSVEQRLRRWMG
jgi:HAD superfamily phosphatase (TIGR01668 family)